VKQSFNNRLTIV